jgi:signal transduction histidine kinase
VTDDGAGIAPSVLPHIFDLFSQMSGAPEAREGGLGTGLWLVIELHAGTVQAFSDGAGRGATFTLRLPLLQSVYRSELMRLSRCSSSTCRRNRQLHGLFFSCNR